MKRWINKLMLWWTLRDLQSDIRATMLQELHDTIDMSRPERSAKIRQSCKTLRNKISSSHSGQRSARQEFYQEKLIKASRNILAPNMPFPHVSINQGLLDDKTKAKLNLPLLEDEIAGLPTIKAIHKNIGFFILLLSVIANYFTFSQLFGNDFIGGNEKLSTAVNILFSLLLVVVEIFGFHFLLMLMPGGPKRNGFAKLIGILGALLLIVSVGITIITRSEIGSTVLNSPQQGVMGKIE